MPQQNNSFVRAFLPGLILGVVVGAFAGVYLSASSAPSLDPKAASGKPAGTFRPHDERPPAGEQPSVIDQGSGDPAGKNPAEPATPGADKPADPKTPAVDPKTPPADPKAPAVNPPASNPGGTPPANPPAPVGPK